ncbi:predicted protein [Thalassiosira pseudonana CCMP1335]|uniref:Procollagen-proline 4-dioxygenase n=1 Tax=Thalassiosira pseudonana TaxID=35128 RepID=B8LC77_THAPS|nr:predicted protein [Thalassiosira pseudonana CCMP1335]EED87314.1 predicted protein [Thalassiosira pseudonana CCMP1335]
MNFMDTLRYANHRQRYALPTILLVVLLLIVSPSMADVDGAAAASPKKNILSNLLGRFKTDRSVHQSAETIVEDLVETEEVADDEQVCVVGGDGEKSCVANQDDVTSEQDEEPSLAVDNEVDVSQSSEQTDTRKDEPHVTTTTNNNDDDDGDICSDKHNNCSLWASQYDDGKACTTRSAYMSIFCPKSCNTCELAYFAKRMAEYPDVTGHPSHLCTDDDFQCAEWAAVGECTKNEKFMYYICQKSCGHCSEESNVMGAGQRLPKKESRQAQAITQDYIDESLKYMAKIKKDRDYSRVRNKCVNRNAECSYWASQGECVTNLDYMRFYCAPACQSCEMVGTVGPKCPDLPKGEPLWKVGDLNSYFEGLVDGSEDYSQNNPKALSRPKLKKDGTESGVEVDGPWVVSLEGFLSDEEADRLVQLGNQQGYKRSTKVQTHKGGNSIDAGITEDRTSHNTWCQEPSCYDDPLVAPIIERIAMLTKSSANHSEHLQLLQYTEGQFYKQHNDYIPQQRDMACGPRIMTLFLYLNDVEEGGGTRFPLLDLTVQPKRGNAILWASVRDDDPEEKDIRTDHEALPVAKGMKYGANAWIHSEDFKTPLAANCL